MKGRKSKQIPIYNATADLAQTYPLGKRVRTSILFSILFFFLSDINLRLYRKTESYFSSHQISKQFSAIRELCVVEYNIIKPKYMLLSLNYPSKSEPSVSRAKQSSESLPPSFCKPIRNSLGR